MSQSSGAPGQRSSGASTASLRAEQGPLAGRLIPVERSPFTIGRSPENDLVVPEAAVSRRHARLENRRGRWFLLDLDSANGTFVNRQRVSASQPVPLNSGDVIAMGGSVFSALLRSPASSDRPRTERPPSASAGPQARQATAGPKRSTPVAAIIVGVVLVAVVIAVVWFVLNQMREGETTTGPGPGLPTVVLPELEVPSLTLPTGLPTIQIPTALPTALPEFEEVPGLIETVIPGLELPDELPLPGSQ